MPPLRLNACLRRKPAADPIEQTEKYELKEKKQLDIELKIQQLSDVGTFSGRLSVYDVIDQGGDVVMPGAFKKTLNDNRSTIPLLAHHDTRSFAIGVAKLRDTPSALEISEARLNLDNPQAQVAYSSLKFARENGLKVGLSIGYQVVKDEVKNGVRYLRELKLFEASLTQFPMNQECWVDGIKHAWGSSEVVDNDKLLLELANKFLPKGQAPFKTIQEYRADRDLKQKLTRMFAAK